MTAKQERRPEPRKELRRELLRFLLVGFATAGLVAACGGDEQQQPAPPAADAPAQAPGGGVAAELRQQVELPDYYPADAPVYPGTKPSRVKVMDNGQISAQFGTEASVDDVVGFMRSKLPELGWKLGAETEMPGGWLLQGTKADRRILVLVSRIKGGESGDITIIAVDVTGEA